ncbi:transposase [Legionella dresdenensis]|uniref:Transposase n=1 Tax=Legionella dresdenensis TaxID=450200 RepID=A0ABV8CDE6_9GAMM
MTLSAKEHVTPKGAILYMALELSNTKWVIAFGTGTKTRKVTIEANDIAGLQAELKVAQEKLKLESVSEVVSCYEAGRDGFWLHRCLEKHGIKNVVIDSSSIEVSRKSRRAKTDGLDASQLLKQLISHVRGDVKFHVARVPSEEEDRRRMHRERGRLKKERTSHTNRIRSLLNLYGIKFSGTKDWALT